MSTEIGSAHLSIYPKLSNGFKRELASSVDGSGAGRKIGADFAGAFGKAALAGIAIAAAGVAALTKASFDQFKQYEQLKGGVETLFANEFGDASKQVIAQANEAYRTAGLSANQYMEQMTGFSASLIQSLGGDTVKAAKIGDMAIIDMSDNANKMGTDMARITDAYQGQRGKAFTRLTACKRGYALAA